jgi:hypothetical protein
MPSRGDSGIARVPSSCALDPSFAPPEAELTAVGARHYGLGMAFHSVAYTTPQYESAISFLECAVQLLPEFPDAKMALASALKAVRSSQIRDAYINLPTYDQLSRIVDLERQAKL